MVTLIHNYLTIARDKVANLIIAHQALNHGDIKGSVCLVFTGTNNPDRFWR